MILLTLTKAIAKRYCKHIASLVVLVAMIPFYAIDSQDGNGMSGGADKVSVNTSSLLSPILGLLPLLIMFQK
jgi:hypothetical protein